MNHIIPMTNKNASTLQKARGCSVGDDSKNLFHPESGELIAFLKRGVLL